MVGAPFSCLRLHSSSHHTLSLSSLPRVRLTSVITQCRGRLCFHAPTGLPQHCFRKLHGMNYFSSFYLRAHELSFRHGWLALSRAIFINMQSFHPPPPPLFPVQSSPPPTIFLLPNLALPSLTPSLLFF